MKRALLVLAALSALLFVLLRERAPSAAAPPVPVPAPVRAGAAESVELSYVESAAAPQRSAQPGATQVFGWLTRADDGKPVHGGKLGLAYFDHSHAEESAGELHARALAEARLPRTSVLSLAVQDDGGFYAELPGKAWIDSAIYTPDPAEGAGPHLARTGVGIDRPLERGALQISFRIDLTLEARGLVVDELGAPIADALIWPPAMSAPNRNASSAADGGFVLEGIEPQALIVEHGVIQFRVQAEGYETVKREVAWQPGQMLIPPFRVVLKHTEQR